MIGLGLDQGIIDDIIDDINWEIQQSPGAFDACQWIQTAQEGKKDTETA